MSDAESIREQMQHVRRSVGDDVQGIVKSAKTLSDWHFYVKNYPWLCMGAALAAGFMVVPKKKPPVNDDAKQILALLKKHNLGPGSRPPETSGGLAKTIFAMATPALMRGVMNFAGQHLTGMGLASRERPEKDKIPQGQP